MSAARTILPPLLHDGDRLTREEFLRRWEAMPNLKHAELIDGIVHVPSPVSTKHSDLHIVMSGWIVQYTAHTPGCRAGAEGTWLMEQDAPQPDIALRILPEYGGQSRIDGKYTAGAPELVVELSSSSTAYDLGSKLRLYQRAGVREFLTVLLEEQRIVWQELVEGRFRNIDPEPDGQLRSRFFPASG
jgi:Uma2 family endonuclease